jgi:hypothetical protein
MLKNLDNSSGGNSTNTANAIGGGNYKSKYLKYKNKYLQLKNQNKF